MKTLIKNVAIDEKEYDILIDDGIITKIAPNISDASDSIIDGLGLNAFAGNCNCYYCGQSVEELLGQGITSVFDFSHDLNATKEVVESGIKVYGVIDVSEEIVDEKLLNQKVNELNLIGIKAPIIYLKNPNTVDESQYAEVINFSKKYGHLMATSVSENLDDVGEIDKTYGMSPVALLESYGFLDFKNLLIDAVYVDKEDVEILKNYDTTICTRPIENLRRGSGIAPIYSMLKNNLNVVVGGDVNSIFQELDLVKNLQSGYLNEENILTYDDIRPLINTNVKKVFDSIGDLKVGDCADIILVKKSVLTNNTPLDVKAVFVDGKMLYNKLK